MPNTFSNVGLCLHRLWNVRALRDYLFLEQITFFFSIYLFDQTLVNRKVIGPLGGYTFIPVCLVVLLLPFVFVNA